MEIMRIAKLKESSVSQLVEKLDGILKSTENNLCCLKCWNQMKVPIVCVPCSHTFCTRCVEETEPCPSCEVPIR